MKIAAYVQMNRVYNPTGVGKHVINMLRCLHKMPGVELHMMTSTQFLRPDGTLPPENPLRDIPVTGIPIPQKQLDLAWLTLGRPLADRWAGGADWIYCPTEMPVPTRRSRLAVTCHTLWWLEKGAPWSGDPRMSRERLKWRWRMAQIRRRAEAVFAVSEFLAQRVAELFSIKPERAAVVGNGVEPAYFHAAETPRDTSQPPYLLVIGGLTEMKDGQAVLQLAELLAVRKTAMQIWVAGGCDAELGRRAAATAGVRLLGYKSLAELPRLLRNAVALLMPSRGEAFGIPAAEAMAAGTPPIVSPWGALPEVVGDGGIILDKNATAADIADIALRLASDESYRSAIAQKGLERAKMFTWEKCADRVLARLRGTDANVC